MTGIGKVIKVKIYYFILLEFSIFFMNYAIFLKLCDQMRFEVTCAKSHHCVISDGLPYPSNKVCWNGSNLHCSLLSIIIIMFVH